MAITALLFVACKNDKKAEGKDLKDAQSTETNMDHGDHDHDEMNNHGVMNNSEMESEEHHHDDEDHAATSSTEREIETSTQKNVATSTIIDSYLQIKNSLVSDSKDGAAKGASMLLMAFSNFDMSNLKGDTLNEYMEILESAKEQAEHIVKSPIDHQREHFETLSTDVNDLVTLLGTDKTLYLDYCPMKKVSWLSETKDIKNPFYGSKMMTCGKVEKQIN